ncbi:MAG TPA: hypothetical protein VG871_15515 [Vicinamibacterales bacterium]|nr:hypothetical protein [Vicinamibacterales bacterium]
MSSWRVNVRTGLFTAVFAALVFGVSIFQIRSPDLYWHIKMGSDWIFKGLSPFVDHYSYTMAGKPIVYVAWGFQVIISLLYWAFGIAGIGLYRFIAFSLTLFLLDRAMARSGVAGSVRLLALALCLVGFILHSEPRPELASLPFEALFVGLFLAWREKRTFRGLIAPLLLLVVWINIHVTGVLGLVIAGAFFGEAGLDEILKGRHARAGIYAGYGAMFYFASYLHHDLSSPLFHLLHFDPRWQRAIQEFEVRDFADYELPLRLYFGLLLLSLPALVRRRYWSGIALLLIAGYQWVRMYKFTSHMLVLTIPFVALSLQHYWDAIQDRGNARARRLFVGGVSVAAALVLLYDTYWIYVRPSLPLNMAVDNRFFPSGLVKYMKATGVRGRVFNHYDWGAYLFFNFDQDVKVFIDQRTNILYDIDVFLEWTRIATVPAAMKKGAEKYKFDYVVSRPDQLLVSQAAIESGVFGLQYVDNAGALFVRGRGRFPETQRYFYYPRCIDDDAIQKSAAEYAIARATLPADSMLTQYLQLLHLYASTKDKASLFRTLYWTSSSPVARLASELAYRSGAKDASLVYLNAVEFKGADDHIRMARLLIERQQFEAAEAELPSLADVSSLRDDQRIDIAGLLHAIREHGPLKFVAPAVYDDMQRFAVDYVRTKGQPQDHCEVLAKLY